MRVLFLLPELSNPATRRLLEDARLSYLMKPYRFHDFLEKVSDLLMETEAITAPIRAAGWSAGRRAPQRSRHSASRGRRPARRQVNRRFATRECSPIANITK